MAGNRYFNWKSSSVSTARERADLHQRMVDYYSLDATRDHYQRMLDAAKNSQPKVLDFLIGKIVESSPKSIVELGCGSGWILEKLIEKGVDAHSYTGAEFSPKVIDGNRIRQPQATWHRITGYETGLPSNSFDVAFSYFVIEHCVEPERHLAELWRLTKPGGSVLLVCPNFVEAGILPSQYLGVGEANAKTLLKKGLLLSAVLSIYDSRIRIRRALRNLTKTHGNFVINFSPTCLLEGYRLMPDVDAVYISNTDDIHFWASKNNAHVELPSASGSASQNFASIVFAKLNKPISG